MIRRETDKGWILIAQTDHSILSAEIMEFWGNSDFNPPFPKEEVLFAIREHDNGWKEWEMHPKINSTDKYPINFIEMDYKDKAQIWRRSFLRYSKEHPYASSLIALHFDKFNTNVYKKNNYAARILKYEIREFVIKNLNLTDTDTPNLNNQIINNLRFVQVGDLISLAICHGWKSIQIDEIPFGKNGTKISLKLESEDSYNYAVKPYPFSKHPLKVSTKAKEISKKTFKNNSEFQQTLKQCVNKNIEFTITNINAI